MKIHPIHFCLWTEDHGNRYDLYITQVQHYKNTRRRHSLSHQILTLRLRKMQAQSCYIRSRMIQLYPRNRHTHTTSQILPEHALSFEKPPTRLQLRLRQLRNRNLNGLFIFIFFLADHRATDFTLSKICGTAPRIRRTFQQ